MHGSGFFYQALIYLTAAVVSVPIAKRLGLGSILGYLIAGVAIGPFALGLVGDEGQDVLHFAEFGVVMMLFLIGLELEPSRVWRMRGPILGLGGLQVGVSTAILAGIGLGFGLEWRVALAVGVTLALSSTAIVLQTLAEKNLMSTGGGQSSFAVLLFQDIAVIPILALLPLLAVSRAGHMSGAEGHDETWVAGLPGWAETLVVIAAVLVIVLAGRYLLQPAFRAIARTGLRELFTAAALLLVISTAALMTKVGVSPALGTFLAGVVLARSEYRHELEGNIDPFKGLLLGLFFIAIGSSIDFGLVARSPGLIVGLMALLIVAKFLVLLLLGRVFRMSLDQNLLFAFSLAQAGEFAFVLLSFAVQSRVVPESLAGMLIAVVALTMAATPILMLINERLIQPRFGTRERQREDDAIDQRRPVIIAGFGSFGSIVGRLLRANGVQTTVLEIESDRVDLLRKLGLQVYYGDASRHALLHAAGADEARLLVVAVDSIAKSREIVDVCRKHFPNLTLLARAKNRSEGPYQLYDMGIEHVYRDKLDSSLRLGVRTLRLLGFRAHQAHRAAQTFRRHDEHAVRELASMRHDRKLYLSTARQRIEELEALLLSDLVDADEMRDVGWDPESLRQEYGDPEREGEDG